MPSADNNAADAEADFGRAVDRALAECRAKIGKLHREHGIELHGFARVTVYFKRGLVTGHDIEAKETRRNPA